MIKINDLKLRNKYIEKFDITNLFSKDIKEFMELFLFKRNEYICKDGEENKYIFFFLEGKAKVYISLSNGKSLLNCFYHDFTVVGEMELINLQSASTNVQALENTYCIGISLDNARDELINDVRFLRFICNSLGEKFDIFSKNSSINLLYPLENRLSSYILAAGEKIEMKGKKVIIFDENLTEIAELLGTSYRHLLRTLKVLSSKGIIEKKRKYFEVIDEKELEGLAADLYK